MSQADLTIANQGFPAFRTELNNSLQALASNNSGTSAPSTTFANQFFYNTSTNVLSIRNEDNDAYIPIALLDQTNDVITEIQTQGIGFSDGDNAITIADGGICTFPQAVTLTSGASMPDSVNLSFGAGNDLQIQHNGSKSIINDNGTGDLELQQGGSAKLTVTSTGVSVTGTALATTDTDATNTGSVTLDFSANQNFVLTLTGAVTLANPSTEQVGQSGFIVFIQDSTGGRTVSLGTDYETAGGAGLTLSAAANTTDVVPYVVAASSRILLGKPQLAFS
tara:strand:- start:2439 stop:3275 length:837 start_codon:yes stop_codon:yes gene_type:complete